ncbi:hypothetical protein PMAYCL1PPCAC_15942, partial [Pristionchus mayeri]
KCVRSFVRLHPDYPSLPDNAHYYVPILPQLLAPDYVPTAEDVLHLRVPTASVNEINFTFATRTIRLIDVGGQRSYRKKWIHHFEGVAAVLFVASIAAYDQHLDDVDKDIIPVRYHESSLPRVSRLRDSVQLFGEMLRTRFLRGSAFILLLNKKYIDSYSKTKPEANDKFSFLDGTTNEEAADFIKEYFLKRRSSKDSTRSIYSHFTCATDTNNVEFVFKAACDIIMNRNLKANGME